VVIVITCVRGGRNIVHELCARKNESSPKNMKLSRVVIDLIGDETKPASRDR